MPPWGFTRVLLLKSICSPQRSWAPLLFTPKDQEKWRKIQRLVWTHSSAGGRKDASGKLLLLLPPKSNCTWQIGQAEHGLLHPVGQTGLTALVLAKHRNLKTGMEGLKQHLFHPNSTRHHLLFAQSALKSLPRWRCHCLRRQLSPLLFLPLLSGSFVLIPNLSVSFYNVRPLFLTLTKAVRKKKYSVSLLRLFVFLETIVNSFFSHLSVKPSSFILPRLKTFSTIHALCLYVTSELLECGDSMSKRGPSSLPIDDVHPWTIN